MSDADRLREQVEHLTARIATLTANNVFVPARPSELLPCSNAIADYVHHLQQRAEGAERALRKGKA